MRPPAPYLKNTTQCDVEAVTAPLILTGSHTFSAWADVHTEKRQKSIFY